MISPHFDHVIFRILDEIQDKSVLRSFRLNPPRRESKLVCLQTNPEGIYDISKNEEMGASIVSPHFWTDSETISQGKH